MTNSKLTKRALLSSVMALILCFTMLLGTTFAWFTDTASTSVNKIEAGKLDVALEMYENDTWVSAEGKTLKFTDNKWEPGCTYELPKLRVANNGSLALKYKVAITGILGSAKLNEVIEWTIKVGETNYAVNAEFNLTAGASCTLTISGHMKDSAGNEYQGLSIDGIAITVYATQFTFESDSTGDQYDKDATLPDIWDGTTETAPTAGSDGVYHITNAAEFAQYINTFSDLTAPSFRGEYHEAKVVLDCDINYNGNTIERSSASYFYGQFDGQNHTISNFTLKCVDNSGFTSLFGAFDSANTCVKNLTIDNATVTGGPQTALIGTVYSGTIDNCRVYNSTIVGEKKVGAIAAYVESNGTIKNCVAKNCNIYCSDTRNGQATVYGYSNGGTFENNAEPVNCTVKSGVTGHIGGDVTITASEKIAYVANATVTVAEGEGNFHRIYSDNATFVNCVFEGEGNHWIGDAATFIDCTFNVVIDNAEPKVGTITFDNCEFNKNVHFASADGADTSAGKFFEAEGCTFNASLTVSNFEKVTLKNCELSGNNWSGKNMISYCPLVIDNCSFTTGIRLSYSDTSKVTCTNGTVDLSWYGGSATVGSN